MRFTVAICAAGALGVFALLQACSSDTGVEEAADSGTSNEIPKDPGSSGNPSTPPRDSGTSNEAATDASKSAMTFFVTSTGSGNAGGNLGGLTGADKKCQDLATAVGGGDHTWRAYLSTNVNNGGTLVNAKDRIGPGPWRNQKGKVIANTVAELHGENFNLLGADVVDEKGAVVPIAGPNRHDILTGSTRAGEATNNNCSNWTSNEINTGPIVGHSDSDTTGNDNDAWNNAHAVTQGGGDPGCSQDRFNAQGGEGRFYCFAAD